jgi:hypothetical protein
MMDVISIKIIRGSELMDCLGGTNAYIVLDWGKLGKASTQAVINSNEPYFGSTLKFRSPYQRIRRKDINDDDYSNDDGCTADASAADDVYKKDTITITRLTFSNLFLLS